MKKMTKRIMSVMLSFVLVTSFLPCNIVSADDTNLHIKAEIDLADLKVGDSISDIRIENSKLWIYDSEFDPWNIPVGIPEICAVFPMNELYMDSELDDSQKFQLYEPYGVYLKYDLSTVDGSFAGTLSALADKYTDYDKILLDPNCSIYFNEEDKITWWEIIDNTNTSLDDFMTYTFSSFEFDDNEKSLELIATFCIDDDKVESSKVSRCSLISNTANGLAFELEGSNITDYIEAKIVPGTYSKLEDFPTSPVTMYAYAFGNYMLSNPDKVEGIEKYGDVGTNIDRSKAVVSFKYESEALQPGDYSVCFSYRKNSISPSLKTSGDVFHFTIPDSYSDKDINSGSCKLIENGKSLYYECHLGGKFEERGFDIIPSEEYNDLLYFYSETELEDQCTFDKAKEDIYMNGKKIDVFVEGEEELFQAAVSARKAAIQIAQDEVNVALPIDFSLKEVPSSENRYAVKINDSNEYINKFSYVWKEYKEVYEKDEVTLNKKDKTGEKLDGDVLLYDNSEKYFVRKAPSDTRLTSTMFDDYDNVKSRDIDNKSQLDLVISSEYLCAGDEITLYISGVVMPLSTSLNNNQTRPLQHNDSKTRYYITLKEEDITNNSVSIQLTSYMSSFTLSKVEIDNSGVYYVEVPNETSNYLKNPVLDKTYVCNIYSCDHMFLDYYTEPITVTELPKTSSGSSKTYKATNESNSAEKILGSGKKGSTRTIVPVEGRKVSSVLVKDANNNMVEVTKNNDGTYSFKQPASNVTVEVKYKNREITLNIGSTEADVDGEKSNLDVSPVIRNDRTMLPIRFVAENLGAKVEWNEKNPEYVLITKGDIKIEITLGSDVALISGKEYKLDSVAFAENDRTYLPVRFVAEALNALVLWDESKPFEVKIFER